MFFPSALPISLSTSIRLQTDGQTTTRTTAWLLLKYGWLKIVWTHLDDLGR